MEISYNCFFLSNTANKNNLFRWLTVVVVSFHSSILAVSWSGQETIYSREQSSKRTDDYIA